MCVHAAGRKKERKREGESSIPGYGKARIVKGREGAAEYKRSTQTDEVGVTASCVGKSQKKLGMEEAKKKEKKKKKDEKEDPEHHGRKKKKEISKEKN